MGSKAEELFGNHIKALMKERSDLDTPAKIAKATGLSQTTVGRIIDNKMNPSLEHGRLICNAFGVSAREDFYGK